MFLHKLYPKHLQYSLRYVAHSQFLIRFFFYSKETMWKVNVSVSVCVHMCLCVCVGVAETEQENSSILFGLVEHRSWCQQTTVKMSCHLRSKLTPCQTPACGIFPSRLQHGCGRPWEQLSLPGKQAVVQPGGFLKLKITVITKKSTTRGWLMLVQSE